jgi:hypothetical protein
LLYASTIHVTSSSIPAASDPAPAAAAAALLLLLLLLLQVTVKAADNSISRDARKELVAGISQALPQHLQCLSGDRIYM